MPRKGLNIYKRKDGRWEGRYIKEHDIYGKARYGYVYANTYSDVKTKLTDCIRNPEIQTKNSKSKTLSYYALIWLDSIKVNVKQSTYAKYMNMLKKHIIPELGNFKMCDIRNEHVKKLQNQN